MENLINALKLQLAAVKLQADAAWNDKEKFEKDWHKFYAVQGALEKTIEHLKSQLPPESTAEPITTTTTA